MGVGGGLPPGDTLIPAQLSLLAAPPPAPKTCASCGRPVNKRCGPCDSATPDPWQQPASYRRWTRDSMKALQGHLERHGIRDVARVEAALRWLTEEKEIADPTLAVVVGTYPRKYRTPRQIRAAVVEAIAAAGRR